MFQQQSARLQWGSYFSDQIQGEIPNGVYGVCQEAHKCYDANAIYLHLEKFDREKKKKSQSVRQDLNPLHSVPYIRAPALSHNRCCCWQLLFQPFYRQTPCIQPSPSHTNPANHSQSSPRPPSPSNPRIRKP